MTLWDACAGDGAIVLEQDGQPVELVTASGVHRVRAFVEGATPETPYSYVLHVADAAMPPDAKQGDKVTVAGVEHQLHLVMSDGVGMTMIHTVAL